jgi:Rad3-related DNA helicase
MIIEQLDAGEPWVISENRHDTMINVKLKPVYVGRFLTNNVWNRAEKVVLSTATMPYRNRPKKWLSRIGRDPTTAKIISKPMPFDAANRQIRADYQIGSMSSGGVVDNWNQILDTLRSIGDNHAGEKGIVHTVSYSRAKDVHNELPELTMAHEADSDADAEEVINRWQLSDKQMLLTPSMTEGVDLVGDKCRFQVLLKAPYRTLGDPRVNYLLNEEGDWEWYNDVTAREIIQSVGRAVRTPDDYATYYVLDSKFDQVLSGRTPNWFEDAIIRSPQNE